MNARKSYILSRVATAVLIAAMVILYQRHALFSFALPIIALQTLAALLMVWARISLGRRSFYFAAAPLSEKLITTGAYRFLRHPIYSAIWLFAWAGVSAHFSLLNAILAAIVLIALLTRVFCEEFCLRHQFSEYHDYAKRTARLIPFVL